MSPSLPRTLNFPKIEGEISMAEKCEGCRTTKEDVYWSHFHTMHFCQFLTRDFHSRLMIPKKFADNKRGELQGKVGIRGPTGVSWEVSLVKNDDGMLYFGDGWEEFVEAYDLQQNDILFFKYTGDSQFDVLMLDRRTLCEKEDSYFVTKCGHQMAQDGCHAKIEDGEDDVDSTRKKKLRVEALVERANSADDEDDEEGLELIKKGTNNSSVTCASRSVTESQKMAALKKACKELSDKSFAIVMRATHVYKSFFLTVPAQWIIRHLIKGNQDVILRVGESPWKIRMIFNSRGRGGFAGGWREFAKENSLEEYDVCLFNLVSPKGEPITLDVTIFRVVPEAVPLCEKASSVKTTQDDDDGGDEELIESSRKKKPRREAVVEENANSAHDKDGDEGLELKKPITQAEKMAAFKKARKQLTDESFIVVMHPTHVNRKFFLNVPAEWLTKHQIQRNQDVSLRTSESSWECKLRLYSQGYGGIGRGWREFAQDNSLEEYDVCLFKLASPKREPITLDVAIFRVAASTHRVISRITTRSFS